VHRGDVIACFDVVAVQEVRRDTSALRFVLARLGPDWRFLTSDVTEGAAGNGERLTFLYRTHRPQPSRLVGEIVLPPSASGQPAAQFARSPYAASFTRAGVEFTLTTLHILWGRQHHRPAPGDHRDRRLDALVGRPARGLERQPGPQPVDHVQGLVAQPTLYSPDA
jgi:hypothetical protein